MSDSSDRIYGTDHWGDPGSPRMHQSWVCFADILGYKQMTSEALAGDGGASFLERLRPARGTVYRSVRAWRDGTGTFDGERNVKYEPFRFKVFTDNLVLSVPVAPSSTAAGEFGYLLFILKELQATLAAAGFFLRGGIAFGLHYMDEDVVFGPALLEAAALDRQGGTPRISLSDSAVAFLGGAIRSFDDELLRDSDQVVFVNYLSYALQDYRDSGYLLTEILASHRHHITENLRRFHSTPPIRMKYEWIARYHNFVIDDFRSTVSEPDWDEPEKIQDYFDAVESLEGSRIDGALLLPGSLARLGDVARGASV